MSARSRIIAAAAQHRLRRPCHWERQQERSMSLKEFLDLRGRVVLSPAARAAWGCRWPRCSAAASSPGRYWRSTADGPRSEPGCAGECQPQGDDDEPPEHLRRRVPAPGDARDADARREPVALRVAAGLQGRLLRGREGAAREAHAPGADLPAQAGGVAVECIEESPRKAWVRFRYPRWMFDGPVLCGMPIEASRGFLRGWYAHNGVSLGNARLGFVCVSEDMSGQFGLCGYFIEYDRDLRDDERLVFAPDERPPTGDPGPQPQPPAADWDPLRLARASRNYAADYLRNGLPTLAGFVGRGRALELAKHAARQ